ncbi:unnamed protein product [marine sediment metagenome]|uniref:Uncharacterized protein n=1 Tax=marine sediment metagenome TaxID=412755 RepID=X1N403_9ZZZZ
MALVKFGPGIVDARGSVGGVVFSKNSTSHYMRARTIPVNPNTEWQDQIRSAMANLCDQWSQILDAAARTAWELYASRVTVKNKLGEAINISGFNHFLRSNIPRVQAGVAVITAGPTVWQLPAQDDDFAIVADETAQTIEFTFNEALAWAKVTGAYMFKYQGVPQNPQRNFFNGPWRYIDKIDGVDSTGASSPDTEDVKFVITELQRQWCYARISMLDGRLSEPFRAVCFVTKT